MQQPTSTDRQLHPLEALHDNVSDFQRDANIITFTPTLIVSDKPLPYLSSCELRQICVRGSQKDYLLKKIGVWLQSEFTYAVM